LFSLSSPLLSLDASPVSVEIITKGLQCAEERRATRIRYEKVGEKQRKGETALSFCYERGAPAPGGNPLDILDAGSAILSGSDTSTAIFARTGGESVESAATGTLCEYECCLVIDERPCVGWGRKGGMIEE
jgi:hypothetical protein